MTDTCIICASGTRGFAVSPPPLDPYRTPALTIPTAGRYVGLGRSGSYELARRGELPTIILNGRRMVRTVDLMVLLGLPIPPPARHPVSPGPLEQPTTEAPAGEDPPRIIA